MTITYRNARLLLQSASALLLAASVGLLVWAFYPPGAPEPAAVLPAEHAATPPAADRTPPHARVASAALWSRRLAGPLYDPPPVAKPETGPSREKPKRKRQQAQVAGLRLVGTVLEAKASRAILLDAQGEIHLRGVGEVLDTAGGAVRIERIEFDQVTIDQQGHQVVLSMDASKVR